MADILTKRSLVFTLILGLMMMTDVVSQTSEELFENDRPDNFKLSVGSSFDASPRPDSQPKKMPDIADPLQKLADDVGEALQIIGRNHAAGASLNEEAVIGASIKAMLKSLDPHSNYYSPAEFKELLGGHRSEYSGTGVFITNFSQAGSRGTYIIATAANSAASKARLRFGDRIVSVDGHNVEEIDSYTVREMIRGERGSKIAITIERSDTKRLETVTLQRERLSQPSIPRSFMLDERTGYIDMTVGVSYSTATELDSALTDLKRRGALAMVIDLRGNTGGIVDQAVAVAERFLPAGSSILIQRGRHLRDDRVWISQNKTPETMPLVLLTDNSTASAAEIVAGAFQDNDRALIVGDTTFGKGLVQNVLELEDGAGLTLTAARYYTPSGRSIQRNYTNTGLYDYYKRTKQAAAIDGAVQATRTLTDRRVYGGNGIEPDIRPDSEAYSSARAKLIDRIFFFAVELANGRVEGQPSAATLRQHYIFGKSLFADKAIEAFIENMPYGSGNIPEKDKEFARNYLEHYLAMAIFGQDEAAKVLLRKDRTVSTAVGSVNEAKELAERARTVSSKKHLARKSPSNLRQDGLR